jgi:PLP dependent protein
MSKIRQNLESVRNRIASAAARCSRAPASIALVAVSKTQSTQAIREAFEAGQRLFGENYAQELRDKAEELKALPIAWHFIGHLQRNKAKYVAPVAACVETVDSVELAQALAGRAPGKLRLLIEVNVGGEASKSGVAPEEVAELARGITAIGTLELAGLMIIPPYDPDPEKGRPYFRKLRLLRDRLVPELGADCLRELSMGMSHDLEVAIEEGATIVRIGTAIFGGRESGIQAI